MRPLFALLCLCGSLFLGLPSASAEESERQFRSTEGGYWTGTLIDVRDDRIILRSADGREGGIPIAKLSEPDQRYVARFLTRREEEAALGPEQIAKETQMAHTLADAPRLWTSPDGKTFEGKLESFADSGVLIRTAKGVFTLPLDRLSDLDQRLLRRWKEDRPVQAGKWPQFVESPSDLEIQFVEGGTEGWAFSYRSPHFEFRTNTRLSVTVVREFARLFEATFEFIKTAPVGFEPQPRESGYFLTELYETKDQYRAAGGPEGSAGVYIGGADKIMIPLPNLGVKQVGNRWILEPGEDNGTLIHEITHQVTRRWLPRWPVWFIEGIADYVECVRYNKGRFTLSNIPGKVKDTVMAYPVRGNSFPMVPLERLMTMDHSTWQSALTSGGATYNYRSAHVLMFYFLHLDGNGDGSPVATYLHALNQGEEAQKALETHLLRGRDYATLSEEVAGKLRSAAIRIDFQ